MTAASQSAAGLSVPSPAEAALHRTDEMLATRVQAQQQAEVRLQFATQAGRLGVWELNLRTMELSTSAMCKSSFGYAPDASFTYGDWQGAVHPDDRDRAAAALERSIANGSGYRIEYRVMHSNGATGWVQVHAEVVRTLDGTAVYVTGLCQDITERLRTEERLRHGQRIEAIGRLAAGVAHDYNTVLQAMLGGLERAMKAVADRPDVHAELDLVLQAGQRGARLTSHLLSSSRQQVLCPTVLELSELLGELRCALERTFGRDISVCVDIAPDLPPIFADAVHLDAALLNLVLNACDAMPRGGTLRIEAYTVGGQVLVAVTDSGQGMTSEVLAQACEPFFSTKGVKGSGLGLSVVQGFARQSGGELHIQSTPGRGARVEIWMPVASRPSAAEKLSDVQQACRPGKVLVVDDDVDVGRVAAAFLRKAGFDVTVADSADEALAELRKDSLFDALVTDYAMPGMDGADLILRARELSPLLPALVITGYAGAEGLGSLPSNVTILRKPFRREDLVGKVRTMIEGAALTPLPPVAELVPL